MPQHDEPSAKAADREVNARSLFADASWRSVGYGVSILAKFLLTPILARILAPEEFGVAAVGFSIVIFFFIVGYAGLPQALIIAKHERPEMWRTAFWLNLGIGIALAAGAFFGAGELAAFVRVPESKPLIMAFSLLIPFQLIQSIGWARLTRDRRHSRLATSDMSAEIAGAVCAVIAAIAGAGVWALVIQQFVSVFVRLPIVLWRTGVPMLPAWAPRDLLPYARFSITQLATDVFIFLVNGLPLIIMGRNLPTAAIGYYDISLRLSGMPRMILSSSLAGALLPAFVKIRDDKERMKRTTVKSIHMSNAVHAPVYFGLAAVAAPAVSLLFGEEWLAAIPVMAIMSVSALIRSTVNGAGSYFQSKGQAGVNLAFAIAYAAAAAGGAYAGAQTGSLINVVLGILAGYLIATPIVFGYWMHDLGARIGDGLINAFKPFLAGGLMAAIVWTGLDNIRIYESLPALRLVAGVGVGALIYGVVMLIIDRPTTLSILGLAGGRIPLIAGLIARFEPKTPAAN